MHGVKRRYGIYVFVTRYFTENNRCPPLINVWAMMIVWRITGKIIRTVLWCIVQHSCAQLYAHWYEQFLQTNCSCFMYLSVLLDFYSLTLAFGSAAGYWHDVPSCRVVGFISRVAIHCLPQGLGFRNIFLPSWSCFFVYLFIYVRVSFCVLLSLKWLIVCVEWDVKPCLLTCWKYGQGLAQQLSHYKKFSPFVCRSG